MYRIIVDGVANKFSCAHFIPGHEKCGRLHGHNFHVGVSIKGDLDENHFVVDFMDVKGKLSSIIEELDHAVLLPGKNPALDLRETGDNVEFTNSGKRYSLPRIDVRILDLPAITSETLAKYIHDKLKPFFTGYSITVRVGESISSFAEYNEE